MSHIIDIAALQNSRLTSLCSIINDSSIQERMVHLITLLFANRIQSLETKKGDIFNSATVTLSSLYTISWSGNTTLNIPKKVQFHLHADGFLIFNDLNEAPYEQSGSPLSPGYRIWCQVKWVNGKYSISHFGLYDLLELFLGQQPY